MVYDPVNERLVVYGGTEYLPLEPGSMDPDDVLAFDCADPRVDRPARGERAARRAEPSDRLDRRRESVPKEKRMNARGTAGRLLVGLAVVALLAGCAAGATPSVDQDQRRRLRVGQPGADAGRARRLCAGQGRAVARGRDVPRRTRRSARGT